MSKYLIVLPYFGTPYIKCVLKKSDDILEPLQEAVKGDAELYSNKKILRIHPVFAEKPSWALAEKVLHHQHSKLYVNEDGASKCTPNMATVITDPKMRPGGCPHLLGECALIISVEQFNKMGWNKDTFISLEAQLAAEEAAENAEEAPAEAAPAEAAPAEAAPAAEEEFPLSEWKRAAQMGGDALALALPALKKLKSERDEALAERNQADAANKTLAEQLAEARAEIDKLRAQKNPSAPRHIPSLAEMSPRRAEIEQVIYDMRDKSLAYTYNASCPTLSKEQMKELVEDIKDTWDFSEEIETELRSRVEDWLKDNVEGFIC